MSDLIRRSDAIDAILHNQEVYSNNFGDDPIDKYTIAIISNDVQTIVQLPSAQQWIPCSERLPEARRSVILSTKEWTGEGCYWETTTNHVIWKGYRWNATYWDDEVIAWMLLPEPYRKTEPKEREGE